MANLFDHLRAPLESEETALRQIAPTSPRFTLLLGLIAGLPALSIDLSAPTLALLPAALDTTVFIAGLSLSLFVLGFGVGQFVGGRGSDHFGRRPILLAALSTYVFAGMCCSIATTGGQLATGRLLQGLGAGACSVQAFAMVQDLFLGEVARRKQAYVSVVLTVMPMVAPALGALIVVFDGWRLVHTSMAASGLVLIFIVWLCVAETKPPLPGQRPRGLGLADSAAMLQHPGFRRLVAVNALSYASIFTYIAGAPVVVIAQLGYGNAVYALVFACTAAALSGGAFLNARLAASMGGGRLVWPALVVQALANAGLVIAGLTLHAAGLWFILPCLLIGCFARGIISPNLTHAAISTHRDRAGLAAALVGLAQLSTAAAASGLLANLLDEVGFLAVGAIMAGLTTAALLLWVLADVGHAIAERS